MFGIQKIQPSNLQDYINSLSTLSGQKVFAYTAEEYGNGYFWIYAGINAGRSDKPIAQSA